MRVLDQAGGRLATVGASTGRRHITPTDLLEAAEGQVVDLSAGVTEQERSWKGVGGWGWGADGASRAMDGTLLTLLLLLLLSSIFCIPLLEFLEGKK